MGLTAEQANAMVLAELKSIRAQVEAVNAKLDVLVGGGVGGARPARPASPSHGGASESAIASDRDLDGQYGNPTIKKDPARWKGDSFVGYRYSETTPEYLEEVASFNDWRASKDDEAKAVDSKNRPKSYWARKDAALARGWAKRLRTRPAAPPASPPPNAGDTWEGDASSSSDDLPF
jgi:hypothetical protein